MRIFEVEQDVGLALKTSQQFILIGKFKVHQLYGVDMVVLQITRDIDSGKTAPSPFVDELVASFDESPYHIPVHAVELLKHRLLSAGTLYTIHIFMSLLRHGRARSS
jgi:hypothetical protein